MLRARVRIEGTRPLLFHAFTENSIPLERGERSGVAGNDPTEWSGTVLMDAGRRLYLLGSYAFGAVRDGSRNVKKGRGSIQALVTATLQVEEERIFLDDRVLPAEPLPRDPSLPVYLDVRGAKNPTTKARCLRYRVACSPGWSCSFHLIWDGSVVSREQMRACLLDAGALSGMGNGRAIGCGRFQILEFAVEGGE